MSAQPDGIDSITVTHLETGTSATLTPRQLTALAGRRRLAIGGDPDELYPAPRKGAFDGDFLQAPDLGEIAEALRYAHPARFDFLDHLQVEYLWKAKGGEQNGKAILGACQKASGLLKHFSAMHFVIWLAADHARDLNLTRWQVEALVFHELSHAGCEGDKAIIFPHDFAGFRSELDHYGPWTSDLKMAARTFQQMAFDLDDDGEISE